MKSTSQIRNELKEVVAKAEALHDLVVAEQRELNDTERQDIDNLAQTREVLNKELDTAIRYEAILSSKMDAKVFARREENQPERKLAAADVPVRVKSYFRPGIFQNAKDAYDSGQFVMAAILGNKKAKSYCRENGLIRNAMSTGDNTKGGFLVPTPLEASIVALREQYGIFGQYAQQVTMGDAVMNFPKINSEVTSYYVGENSAITASDVALALVRLEARKLATLTAVSSELNEDAVVSVAETLAQSIAQTFANQEDEAGFNGDGTSTYGGIVGLKSALAAGSVYDAISGNNTFGTLDLEDFEAVVGKRKMYPGARPAWFISQPGWANSMLRLAMAAGANTAMSVADGLPLQFMGYPVIISQVCLQSLTSTGSTIGCYFGDLAQSAIFGRLRGITIQADASYGFNTDSIYIRATQRYDINVHDRGTASASGGMIALKFAA
jgi:HK97 family phage major capsid protein